MIHKRLQFLPFTMCPWPSSLSRNLSQPIISKPLHVNDLSVQVHLYARSTSVETFHFLRNRDNCATMMRVQTVLFKTNVMGQQLWLSKTWLTAHSEAGEFVDLYFGAFTTCLTSKPCKPNCTHMIDELLVIYTSLESLSLASNPILQC